MTDWTAFLQIGVPILSGVAGVIIGGLITVLWERRKIGLEHKLEIMREMTATFHELSNEHYSQLGQAAFNLQQILHRGDKGEASFFRLVKFLRQYERLPMLQLNDTLSESTFDTMAGEIRTLIRKEAGFSEEDFVKLEEGDINEKFKDFVEIVKIPGCLQDTFNKYQAFISRKSNELQDLLHCFSDILFMEITRGKEPWYKPEELCKQTREGLEHLGQLEHLDEGITKQASSYYDTLLHKYEKKRTKVNRKFSNFGTKLRSKIRIGKHNTSTHAQ